MFYDIFVWQTAPKIQIIKFVTKLLMAENEELPISTIAKQIDFICEKINLNDLLAQNNNNSSSIKTSGIA
jgi:hypothetical protein